MDLLIIYCIFYENTTKQKTVTTKVVIKLQFLQKLSRQKPFWDKARFSSLLNKRFNAATAPYATAAVDPF